MTTAPADSLVALAERKQLPFHQFMDAATVDWIAAHRLQVPIHDERLDPALGEHARWLLSMTALPASWFAEPQVADSIHGLRHGMRTAAYAALLAEQAGLEEHLSSALVIAAAIHDCQRLHDKDDTGHGARAAAWLDAHAGLVADHFRVSAGITDKFWQAAIAVRLHDIPYQTFAPVNEAEYVQAKLASDLLKAADALDRYRLPKLKWWPNPSHLRIALPAHLQSFAYELVLETERAHLDGLSSAAAVEHALSGRGLL